MMQQSDIVSAVDSFIAELAASGASPKTVGVRRLALNRFARHCTDVGVSRVQDITLALLENWRRLLQKEALAEATVEQYLRGPRLLLDRLEKRGELFENPARRMALHRPSRRLPRVPTVSQVRCLLDQPSEETPAGLRDRALLEFLYSTGARISEALAVDLCDLNLEDGTVRLHGKGRRDRMCPVGSECRRRLERYCREARPLLARGGDQDALWLGIRGERPGVQNAEVRMREYCRQAGLSQPLTPHALRRAMATHMLHEGADPMVLQMILGHASLKHLSQYLRLTVTDIRRMHRQSRLGE